MSGEKGGQATLEIAAAVISDPEGRLLLVRKQGTAFFMQPGGKIDGGEAPLDALCRELKEELGLQVAQDLLLPLGVQTAPAANEPGMTIEAHLYALVIDEPVEAAAEIAEAVWVSREEASQLRLAPLTRDYVMLRVGEY
ncbi:NUDIX domain-containing protein [Halomonas aquamarina]|uniref:NUDIX domain-containing protein n=1 Tax=Vreelandella aquamarina TaxID=77097 RepID=A0ACC5VS71_9GAMM|nr:NUDIX domain-containing protein [Halomonas aquamarina]MBZ5486735.1 NUDIX domain-containing protein [Halomonas aquamarina]